MRSPVGVDELHRCYPLTLFSYGDNAKACKFDHF